MGLIDIYNDAESEKSLEKLRELKRIGTATHLKLKEIIAKLLEDNAELLERAAARSETHCYLDYTLDLQLIHEFHTTFGINNGSYAYTEHKVDHYRLGEVLVIFRPFDKQVEIIWSDRNMTAHHKLAITE